MELDPDDDLIMRDANNGIKEPTKNSNNLCAIVATHFAVAGWKALTVSSQQYYEFPKLLRSVRLWNRTLTLAILATGYVFPSIGKWSSRNYYNCWRAATGINVCLIYFLIKIIIQLFWLAWFVFRALILATVVGSYFTEEQSTWKRRVRMVIVYGWMLHHGYRLYDYCQYFCSWWSPTVEVLESLEKSTFVAGEASNIITNSEL
jgi:hypothetical protein